MRVTVLDGVILGGLRAVDVPETDWERLGRCPICRAGHALSDLGTVHGRRPAGALAACTDCEHVFLCRRPRSAWFDAFYASDWDERNQDLDAVQRKRKPPDPRVLDFCRDELSAGSRVLDVGAGFGSQLVAFRDAGHEVQAVERSRHRARYLEDVLGIPCQRAAIEAIGVNRPVDLALAHHVLEHVSDPWATVAHLAGIVREGGLVYIAVPALWREVAAQTLHFAPHLSQFTPRSLARLLVRHGFEVVRASDRPDLQVLARRVGGESLGADEPGAGDREGAGFSAALGGWLTASFGQGAGTRTLLWSKAAAGEGPYEQHVFGGRRRAPVLLAASRHAKRIPWRHPRALARAALPAWTQTKSVRVLPIRVEGGPPAPVEIHHPGHEAPVWVK